MLLFGVAVLAPGCLGSKPVVGPDPAAIEAAKARGGQAIDPTHIDAGDLLAIESGALDRSAPQQPVQQTTPPNYTPSAHEVAPPTTQAQQPSRVASVQPKKRTLRKPKARKNEIVAVAVPPVKGAPGDGNIELTEAMRDVLEGAGWPVESRSGPDTLTVSGKVEVGKNYQGKQPVRLAWVVVRVLPQNNHLYLRQLSLFKSCKEVIWLGVNARTINLTLF